jgi:hypothetical protein
LSQRYRLRALLVLMLAVSFSRYAASSAKAAVPEQAASIPAYQWQFLSASEKAAVDASLRVIMNERFRNITLNIRDDAGVPYTGKLQVAQTSTEFISWVGWPSIFGGVLVDWPEYIAMTPSRSRDLFAPWSDVERILGKWDFDWPDQDYADSKGRGLTDFHINLGPAIGECCYWVPDWAKDLEKSARRGGNASDYEAFKSAMREYVEAVVSHFKGRIQQYELWWEANAWYGNGYWPLDRIIDIIKMEAFTIRAVDPAARICIELVRMTPA